LIAMNIGNTEARMLKTLKAQIKLTSENKP
jgi:hypothetical protein